MSIRIKFENFLLKFAPDAIKYLVANTRIQKQLENWEHAPEFSDIRHLEESTLKTYIDSEWTRAKELDEKLNKLTASLSIAVTVGSVVTKAIFDGLENSPLKTTALILSSLSMALFLAGAIIGFNGLRPKERFGYGAKYLRTLAEGGQDAVKTMWHAASGFQVTNNIRSNQATVAITFIRNGVIFFTASIFLSLFAKSTNTEPQISPSINNELTHPAPEQHKLPAPDTSTNFLEPRSLTSPAQDSDHTATSRNPNIKDHDTYCRALSSFRCPALTLQFKTHASIFPTKSIPSI